MSRNVWMPTVQLRYFRSSCGSYMHLYQQWMKIRDGTNEFEAEWRIVPTDDIAASGDIIPLAEEMKP